MKLRHILFSALAAVSALAATANDVLQWKASLNMTDDKKGTVEISATIADGFHFYSFAPEGGYNSLELTINEQEGVTVGTPIASVEPTKYFDKGFEEDRSAWFEDVDFTIPVEITDGKGHKLVLTVFSQACDEVECKVPERLTFDFIVGDYVEAEDATEAAPVAVSEADTLEAKWWAPVETTTQTTDQSPWAILIIGFIGGLAALITPCVWPLIPMTLSFFLKKTKGKKRVNKDALTYGLSIVVIYLVLGIAVTLIFGASKLNALSTNAIFNIIFFLILVIFAISFFGAFDIKLPEKWSNAMDSKAESTSGLVSIFFMAFTLVLVSFSCTGPIIGTLLVEAASQGNILGPALGMGGFALGLALPFTLCAMFPSLLNEMPKSGGWLNSVKVVLGFIELILSLKFLSVADMAYGWGILDREVFISLWIVLFTLLGLYLLGKIRFSHDSKLEHVSVTRFMLSLIPLSYAVYLLPGLWGAPLKSTSAFAPPMNTQDFNLYVHDTNYIQFDGYEEGMNYALKHDMPVIVDFSGFGCTNCRNMEMEVLDTDAVREKIAENFVMIQLMVDDKKALPQPYEFDDNGKKVKISTIGDKWSMLQSYKFGANSQPYYIVLDNEGNAMNNPVYYDNDVEKFLNWLDEGLANYKK